MASAQDILAASFGVPAWVMPWADRFFEPTEMQLIRALAGHPKRTDVLCREIPGLTLADVERAYARGIVVWQGRDGLAPIALADFRARLDIWTLFEDHGDIPAAAVERLNAWELEDYAAKIARAIGASSRGDAAGTEADLAYLLLEEAEEIVRQAPHLYLWPCNCRATLRRCRQPLDVCLRFSNDRGLGLEISCERAVAILREADEEGLLRTGYADRPPAGHGGVCSCCTDCCFPHLAADQLDVGRFWPRRRHRAAVQPALCKLCGRCAERCPFGALTADDGDGGDVAAGTMVVARNDDQAAPTTSGRRRDAATRARLVFSAERCRGCGLCATACPEKAIVMDRLHVSPAGAP